MNPDQKLWVRGSQMGQVTDQFETLDFRGALKAIHDSFMEHNGRKVMMNIEVSNSPLKESLLNREQQTEQAIVDGALTDESEIIYPPDVTLGECNEAFASPEGELMFKYQRPENRIGVPPERLNEIQSAYSNRFPRVAPHAPLWPKIESNS